MGETNERANSSNSWSRRKIAILIVGILFIFMLVVILGYVFVKMSDSSSDDDFHNLMTTVPTILSNETTVRADRYSILKNPLTDSIQANLTFPITSTTSIVQMGECSTNFIT